MEPSEADSVQFEPWDADKPLSDQPRFHVIIHKLTEDIDRPEPSARLQALEEYLKRNPSTVIVDPISSVRKVVSRARTCSHLKSIEDRLQENCPFRQPNFLVIAKDDCDEVILKALTVRNMTFPLICKPVEACGTPNSHHMVVIVNPKDIAMVPRPCILQQYYDHDAFFYKVYVIDRTVSVYCRASLPNLEACISSSSPSSSSCYRSVAFDSRYSYPTLQNFLGDEQVGSIDHFHHPTPLSSPSPVLLSLIENTAKALREEFGLSLFGFDVIVPCKEEDSLPRPVVIDVNYFPSYKEVGDFPSQLRRYLRSLAFPDQSSS
eukprot:scaffold3341_cov165-Ochromonas_danica.AAC.3